MTVALPENMHQLLGRWSEALSTEAFRSRQVTLDHLAQALPVARQRSFQRLIQSLLREGLIDADACIHDEHRRCWLALPEPGALLRFDHLEAGRMASWDLRGSVTLCRAAAQPYALQYPSELLQLLSGLLTCSASAETLARLAQELDDSFRNDTLCLAYHQCWNRQLQHELGNGAPDRLLSALRGGSGADNPTLLLEQWGTLGHPWHPNYKTKLGLSAAQVVALSPEFEACIGVRLAALHRQHAHAETLGETPDYLAWWHSQFPQAAARLTTCLRQRGLEPEHFLPLPVHPWQAQEVLPKLFAREIAEGQLVLTDIQAFQGHPTMSFRTVLPEASREAPMVKLPVSLRLTSVQRTVSPRSARMGPRVSQLLLQILEREPELARLLSVVPERVGLHFNPQPADDERARQLSVLYRDNPLSLLAPGEMAIPVGSLFATDGEGRPLLRQWVALAEGSSDSQAMLAFFRHYLEVAVPGLLGMYLLYGVAFEAHQQNSFMLMGRDGRPQRLLLRDFGDIRIYRPSLQRQGLDLELHDPQMTLFDDAGFVRDKLLHTVFMCHLGELALLCARHWQVAEELLWNALAEQLERSFQALRSRVPGERWETEHRALLAQDWPAKSFMRMRLEDSHADMVGRLRNPLSRVDHAG
ncbi:IucA/IucC family protein [Pseudomonas benzenivorans]|uniref:Siderophore synthetase n=1 Tax=Pseudomonas benzenivorans TaxID=556533 RepID=A0ABY5H4Q0_9PSED|nr:IucA/IucC family protein [Pseudomonas benzenivorans]UTW07272.1 siderophore synthetase [Pseudomonas benzenivorans]